MSCSNSSMCDDECRTEIMEVLAWSFRQLRSTTNIVELAYLQITKSNTVQDMRSEVLVFIPTKITKVEL